MLRDDKSIAYFGDTVFLAKVNAEVDTNLAQRYSISGYPTAVLVNPDGSEIDRVVGYAETDEYLQILRDYLNGIGTLDDLLAKADAQFERELAFEIGDKYKYRGGQDSAFAWFNRVIEAGEPTDSMSGAARMAIADTYSRARERSTAIAEYDKIVSEFKGTNFEPDAMTWAAYLTGRMGDSAKAVERFEAFIKAFPDHGDAEWAKSQVDKYNGKAETN